MEVVELCYGCFHEDLGINLVLLTINLEGVFSNEWMRMNVFFDESQPTNNTMSNCQTYKYILLAYILQTQSDVHQFWFGTKKCVNNFCIGNITVSADTKITGLLSNFFKGTFFWKSYLAKQFSF